MNNMLAEKPVQSALFEVKREEMKSIYARTTAKNLIYEPSERCPNVEELVDVCKSKELEAEIERSGVSDKEKRFLRLASARHNGFNYDLIADYYSHASAEVQALMENSGLVIVDFDKAVELGFVRMSENIVNHYKSEQTV